MRHFFGDDEPLGARVSIFGATREVVGVVGGIRDYPADPLVRPAMWFPIGQVEFVRVFFAARVRHGTPESLLPACWPPCSGWTPNCRSATCRRCEARTTVALTAQRLAMRLFQLFSALTLVLAASGLYGLLAYLVHQRRKELNIRAAVGATRVDLAQVVLRESLAMALAGGIVCLVALPVASAWWRALTEGLPDLDAMGLDWHARRADHPGGPGQPGAREDGRAPGRRRGAARGLTDPFRESRARLPGPDRAGRPATLAATSPAGPQDFSRRWRRHSPGKDQQFCRKPASKIALFIDFDNIEIGVKTTLGGHFDVGAVLEAMKERGEVVTKVAYGDWTRAGDYSRSLTQHAIQMVQRNLTPGGDKNGADINLALDALEMAFTHSHINAFVIVGGDSDFMALVEKLKQYDRQVFVVGGRAFTSVILQKNCTEFIAYENLIGRARQQQPGRREQGTSRTRCRSSSAPSRSWRTAK